MQQNFAFVGPRLVSHVLTKMDTTPSHAMEQLGRDGLAIMWFSIFSGAFLLLFLVYVFIYTEPLPHEKEGEKK